MRVCLVIELGDLLCDVALADHPGQACFEHLAACRIDFPCHRQAWAAELLDDVACRPNPVEGGQQDDVIALRATWGEAYLFVIRVGHLALLMGGGRGPALSLALGQPLLVAPPLFVAGHCPKTGPNWTIPGVTSSASSRRTMSGCRPDAGVSSSLCLCPCPCCLFRPCRALAGVACGLAVHHAKAWRSRTP